jgi:DNA (cytosine-5)-methyltransferase 1
MRVLDLFSGIGGFSLGLERAGMHTVAFCEIDPYCRAVIARHWPRVPIFTDICELTAKAVANSAGPQRAGKAGRRFNSTRRAKERPDGCGIDVICGGFPCQDISVAGKGAGISGARSGLWREFSRIIGLVQPNYVIVENVPALLNRGMEVVLGNLAQIGYDAEWEIISAADVGADHIRERIWIIAYPHVLRKLQSERIFKDIRGRLNHSIEETSAYFDGARLQERFMHTGVPSETGQDDYGENPTLDIEGSATPHLVRRFHGIPNRMDRIKALGNSVVPQIPEIIGRAIMRSANQSSAEPK